MAITYEFDPRGFPPHLRDDANPANDKALKAAFLASIEKILCSSFLGTKTIPATATNLAAVIVGTLVNKDQFIPGTPSFTATINEAWVLALKDAYVQNPANNQPNRDLYDKIAGHLEAMRPPNPAGPPAVVFFQEIAAVAAFVIENAKQVPADSSYLASQVRIGLDRYVGGTPSDLTIVLPSITGAQGTDSGINEPGVRSVGSIAAAFHLDRANVIRVVDRVTELYMQGLIPLNYDVAAKAIEDYYWNAEDRLHEGARSMIYGRVLGVPSAEVSKEVVPNRERDGYLRTFIAALAEHDRQQTISDLLQPGLARAASLTVEQVRKAGRDLLANASLYGWGGTQAVARRITQHMQVALDILSMPQVQQIYGVTSAYQVIERVSQAEFSVVPNMLKEKTLAESEQKIYSTLAKNIPAFLAADGTPLFEIGAGGAVPAQVTRADEIILKTAAQSWLAAAGIGDAQVEKLAQPSDTGYLGSLPTFGGATNGKAAPANSDVVERLRQMVSTGNAPSLDQLQQLLPSM